METAGQRLEFWRRFDDHIRQFRAREPHCDVVVNPFEVGSWRVKFSVQRPGLMAATAAVGVTDHPAATNDFLIAATPMLTIGDRIESGWRVLIPVLVDASTGHFVLHADHGPVDESRMCDYFGGVARALLDRL